jgi:hypothetical protein
MFVTAKTCRQRGLGRAFELIPLAKFACGAFADVPFVAGRQKARLLPA